MRLSRCRWCRSAALASRSPGWSSGVRRSAVCLPPWTTTRRRPRWRPRGTRVSGPSTPRRTTASACPSGASAGSCAGCEPRIRRCLAGRPRYDYLLSTKVGRLLESADGDVDGAEGYFGTPRLARVRDYSRDGVLASLEASLGRLGVDRIDIALIHDPDDHGPEALDGAYPALAELRAEGVIGAVGAGMNQVEMLEWFLPRADLDCGLGAGRYTLLDTRAAVSLFPECQRRGVGVLAAGVFNSGVLVDPAPGATYDYQPAAADVVDRARRIGTAR